MNQIDIRRIRVFISSTFEDMKDERDYLIRKVFPELRHKAAERDVTLIDVDLRWGITEEQSRKGKVIDICFNEIDKSIPFFIGIVGNRYGWCPEETDVEIDSCHHYKIIKKYLGRELSATEMEMQYAVLEREQPMYASFFIDSRKMDSGQIDYPDKLNELKEKIIKNQRYKPYYYSSPKELGEKVTTWFMSLLDKLFPIDEKLSEVERIELSQRINMDRLCSIYSPDEKRFSKIDSFVDDLQKRQLLIVGDSGCGKSSFVAEWVRRNMAFRNIVYYSVGCGGNHSNLDVVLNQLALLINHKCNCTANNNNTNLNSALDCIAENDEKLIIVLDAFNQIELREDETNLNWLPEPKGKIKYIITVSTDLSKDCFNLSHLNSRHILSSRKGTEEYVFENFSTKIRKEIICTVLKEHGKEPICVNEIASSKLFHNVFALRVLLDELIIYPKHDAIKKQVERYLDCESVKSFILSVVNRYENDYGELLVRKTLSLLAISEKGFNERELFSLINADMGCSDDGSSVRCIITPIEWSQFFWAFRDNLSIRENGLFGFSHELVRNVVYDKYVKCPKDELIRSLRKLIIDTFKEEHSPRAYLELRHQYQELDMYEQLYTLLSDSEVYYYLIKCHWGLLSESWENLCVYIREPYPLSSIINAWVQLSEERKKETYIYTEQILAAIILDQQGHLPPNPCPEAFARMQELCIPYQEDVCQIFKYTYSAAVGYMDTTIQIDHALSLLLKAFSIMENPNLQKWSCFNEDLIRCCENIAYCYNLLGKIYEEEQFLKRIIEPCIILYGEFHPRTQFWYYQVGFSCFKNGSFVEAIEYLQKSLDIAEKGQDLHAILKVCNGLVQCYDAAFRKEKKEKKNCFSNNYNYSNYFYYYEQLAMTMKEQGQIKEFEKIIKDLNKKKKKYISQNVKSKKEKWFVYIWHRLQKFCK